MPRKRENDLADRYRKRRRSVLQQARRHKPIDAFLATDASDVRYLSGLTEGSESLLFGDDWAVVMTRAMFADQASKECPGTEVVLTDPSDRTKPPADNEEIARQLRKHRARRLGFDETLINLARYRSLTKHVSERRLAPFRGLVVSCRAVKDRQEISLTLKAVRIAEKAFRDLIARGADYFVGQTERQLAAELEYLMRSLGADRQGFLMNGIIVACGPNSASCHHFPTSRRVRRGDAVLFDWGAEVEGYRSDITRVIFIGSVPDTFREIYSLVENALQKSVAAIRPGVRTHSIDKIARGFLTEAGYGEEFRHGLGHGIGLQIHEQPRLTQQGTPVRLKRNMLVTVEPGIYLDGIGGVRLEDDILVTATGAKNLCTLPTALDDAVVR